MVSIMTTSFVKLALQNAKLAQARHHAQLATKQQVAALSISAITGVTPLVQIPPMVTPLSIARNVILIV